MAHLHPKVINSVAIHITEMRKASFCRLMPRRQSDFRYIRPLINYPKKKRENNPFELKQNVSVEIARKTDKTVR